MEVTIKIYKKLKSLFTEAVPIVSDKIKISRIYIYI